MTLIEFTVPSFKVRITYGTLCIAIAAAWLLYEFVDSAGVAGAIVLAACAGIGAAAGLIYNLCSDLLLCALDALGRPRKRFSRDPSKKITGAYFSVR